MRFEPSSTQASTLSYESPSPQTSTLNCDYTTFTFDSSPTTASIWHQGMHNTFRYGGGYLLHFPLFFNTFFCNTIPLFSTEYDSTRHGRYIHEHMNNRRFSDSSQEDHCSTLAGSDGGWMICIWAQHERDTAAWRYGSLISVWLWLGYSTTNGRDGESTAVPFYAALDGKGSV